MGHLTTSLYNNLNDNLSKYIRVQITSGCQISVQRLRTMGRSLVGELVHQIFSYLTPAGGGHLDDGDGDDDDSDGDDDEMPWSTFSFIFN